MYKLKEIIKKEAKIIAASILIGLIMTAGITTKAYSDKISEGISQKFIRFHVIANSDSDADQQLKLKVRDGVLEALKEDLEACETIEETREMLKSSLWEITQVAERIIKNEGYDYSASVSLENVLFPTREYGDVTLAAGMYEALRIKIGEGSGKNWWCVVYPPLCYVDATKGTVSEKSKQDLRRNLTDSEYKLIVQDDSISVKIKFKVVEMWQERKMSRAAAHRRQVLNSL